MSEVVDIADVVRPDPLAYVGQVLREVIPAGAASGLPAVFPVRQAAEPDEELEFPSAVFYAVGNQAETTFSIPSWERALVVRYEVRARSLAEVVNLDRGILRVFRRETRLRQRLSLFDDFEETLNILRRTRTVVIKA